MPPIVQSATFVQRSPGASHTDTYSRCTNPTVTALEENLGAFEDAPPAVVFASGLAATHALALACLRAGDHVIVGQACYGGTVRLFRETLAPLGVRASFVDAADARAVGDAIHPDTRLVLIETPANPTLTLVDIDAIARVVRHRRIRLAVDNTFLTASLQRPLDLGADITLASTTKWVEGHHATIGGALVSRDTDLLDRLRRIRKSVGSIQSPLDAWLTLQGSKTLPLRIRRHSESAHRIAAALEQHPALARVIYPGLPSFPQHALAERQHIGAHGGVIALELAGGRDAAVRFAEALSTVLIAESLGGVESLLTHPETMTHADVPLEQRRAAGISGGLVRLSVGLEDPEDLLRDIQSALEASEAGRPVACGKVVRDVR